MKTEIGHCCLLLSSSTNTSSQSLLSLNCFRHRLKTHYFTITCDPNPPSDCQHLWKFVLNPGVLHYIRYQTGAFAMIRDTLRSDSHNPCPSSLYHVQQLMCLATVLIIIKRKSLRWLNVRRLQGHLTKINKNKRTNVRHKQDKCKVLSDAAELFSHSAEREVQSWDDVWMWPATVTTWQSLLEH